jgi:hypothetical protein
MGVYYSMQVQARTCENVRPLLAARASESAVFGPQAFAPLFFFFFFFLGGGLAAIP